MVQTVKYEPKMLKNFRLTAAEASKIVPNYSFIVYHADSEKFISRLVSRYLKNWIIILIKTNS